MGLILSDKDLISILILFTEEKTRNGSSRFKFINSKEQHEAFKAQGYITDQEFERFKNEPSAPGMPVKQKPDSSKLINSLKTYWSPLTWKAQNEIYSRCLKQVINPQDGSKTAEIDGILYRELKLKKCLKRWSLKDETGKEIPVTENVIDNLHPEIALELLSNFEKVTENTEEDKESS